MGDALEAAEATLKEAADNENAIAMDLDLASQTAVGEAIENLMRRAGEALNDLKDAMTSFVIVFLALSPGRTK